MYGKPLNIIAEKHRLLSDLNKLFPAAYSIAGINNENNGDEYDRHIECNDTNNYIIFVKLSFKYFIKLFSPNCTPKIIPPKVIKPYLVWKKKITPQRYNVFYGEIKAEIIIALHGRLRINNKYQLPDEE